MKRYGKAGPTKKLAYDLSNGSDSFAFACSNDDVVESNPTSATEPRIRPTVAVCYPLEKATVTKVTLFEQAMHGGDDEHVSPNENVSTATKQCEDTFDEAAGHVKEEIKRTESNGLPDISDIYSGTNTAPVDDSLQTSSTKKTARSSLLTSGWTGEHLMRMEQLQYLLDGMYLSDIKVKHMSALKLASALRDPQLCFLIRAEGGYRHIFQAFRACPLTDPVIAYAVATIACMASKDLQNAEQFTVDTVRILLSLAFDCEIDENESANCKAQADVEEEDDEMKEAISAARRSRKRRRGAAAITGANFIALFENEDMVSDADLITPSFLALVALANACESLNFVRLLASFSSRNVIECICTALQTSIHLLCQHTGQANTPSSTPSKTKTTATSSSPSAASSSLDFLSRPLRRSLHVNKCLLLMLDKLACFPSAMLRNALLTLSVSHSSSTSPSPLLLPSAVDVSAVDGNNVTLVSLLLSLLDHCRTRILVKINPHERLQVNALMLSSLRILVNLSNKNSNGCQAIVHAHGVPLLLGLVALARYAQSCVRAAKKAARAKSPLFVGKPSSSTTTVAPLLPAVSTLPSAYLDSVVQWTCMFDCLTSALGILINCAEVNAVCRQQLLETCIEIPCVSTDEQWVLSDEVGIFSRASCSDKNSTASSTPASLKQKAVSPASFSHSLERAHSLAMYTAPFVSFPALRLLLICFLDSHHQSKASAELDIGSQMPVHSPSKTASPSIISSPVASSSVLITTLSKPTSLSPIPSKKSDPFAFGDEEEEEETPPTEEEARSAASPAKKTEQVIAMLEQATSSSENDGLEHQMTACYTALLLGCLLLHHPSTTQQLVAWCPPLQFLATKSSNIDHQKQQQQENGGETQNEAAKRTEEYPSSLLDGLSAVLEEFLLFQSTASVLTDDVLNSILQIIAALKKIKKTELHRV